MVRRTGPYGSTLIININSPLYQLNVLLDNSWQFKHNFDRLLPFK